MSSYYHFTPEYMLNMDYKTFLAYFETMNRIEEMKNGNKDDKVEKNIADMF